MTQVGQIDISQRYDLTPERPPSGLRYLTRAGWIRAISKVTCRFIAGCGADPARRIVTIFEDGLNCKAPILKVGVSCIDAISKANVSWTAVCIAPAG